MVRHHVLIGLGLKRKNFRNRALKYLMDRKIIGSGMRPAIWSGHETMRPAVMPPSHSQPTKGSGPMTMRPAVEPPSNSRQRAPLKFNY